MPGATNDKQKKHPPTPFKGGTLFVTFRCLMQSLGSRNDGDLFRHHSFLQGIYQMIGATNDKQKKHPPTPFKGGTLFVIFRCLMQSLGSTNDKPGICHSERSEESHRNISDSQLQNLKVFKINIRSL